MFTIPTSFDFNFSKAVTVPTFKFNLFEGELERILNSDSQYEEVHVSCSQLSFHEDSVQVRTAYRSYELMPYSPRTMFHNQVRLERFNAAMLRNPVMDRILIYAEKLEIYRCDLNDNFLNELQKYVTRDLKALRFTKCVHKYAIKIKNILETFDHLAYLSLDVSSSYKFIMAELLDANLSMIRRINLRFKSNLFKLTASDLNALFYNANDRFKLELTVTNTLEEGKIRSLLTPLLGNRYQLKMEAQISSPTFVKAVISLK